MMTRVEELPAEVETYLENVEKRMPLPLPQRTQYVAELRAHMRDRLDGGATPDEAIAAMGPEEEVARDFLRQVELRPASLAERTGAFALDILIGMLALTPLWVLLWVVLVRRIVSGVEVSSAIPVPPVIFFAMAALLSMIAATVAILSVSYFPVFEALHGQTPGKRRLGIYVVREDGQAAGWGPAILRRLPFLLEIFWIDAAFALFTRRRQRAFDLVARTLVVRRPGG
jgi:uncharacterized RDD family membrane protein YckC